MASSTACPVGYSSTFGYKPTSCPAGFSSSFTGNTESTFGGFPGSFGGFGGVPSTFEGRSWGWPSTFEGRSWGWPSTFGGFGGYPSTFGGFPGSFGGFGGFPSAFEGRSWGWPSTFGGFGGYPSTFGGFPGSFGGFGGWEPSTFGGWNNTSCSPFEWSRFGGFPGSFGSRFGGETSTFHNVGFRPSSYLEYYSLTNPIRVLDREGTRCLWLCYEMKGFKPEECNVTFDRKERCIIVEATHDIKEGKEHHITRKFYRKFVLPETLSKIDLTTCELKSYFNNEGYLFIECTLPKMTTEELSKYPTTGSWSRFGTWGFPSSTFGGYGDSRPITVKIC